MQLRVAAKHRPRPHPWIFQCQMEYIRNCNVKAEECLGVGPEGGASDLFRLDKVVPLQLRENSVSSTLCDVRPEGGEGGRERVGKEEDSI